MSYGLCTAQERGHRSGSQRERDCPAGHFGTPVTTGGIAVPVAPSVASGTTTHSIGHTQPAAVPPFSASDQKWMDSLAEKVLELALADDDIDRIWDTTFLLLDAVAPPGRRVVRRGHVLCVLFEDAAVALEELINAPGNVAAKLAAASINGPTILAVAVKVLVKQAIKLALAQATAPLSLIRLKLCFLALAFCPDDTKHPGSGLLTHCEKPLLDAAMDLPDKP